MSEQIATMAGQYSRDSRQVERCRELQKLEIRFISATEFAHLSDEVLTAERPTELHELTDSQSTSGSGYQQLPLLTPAGEQYLFRRMNYLKHRARALQKKLSTARPCVATMDQLETFLSESARCRDELVSSNLRLVTALAGKFAGAPTDFDELVCEGNLVLVNAVDKFDYSRGFRFSTYATHAVQRHYFRLMQRRQRRQQREVSTANEILSDVACNREPNSLPDFAMAALLVSHFDECLDEREKFILEHRFGLNNRPASGTLKAIAESVGLSKERVRQLQARAVEKLQDLALRLQLHPETAL
ncbi:sigma-70 family RNA polymerase sigma factor [Planctomicrobium sp. SH664]|uniref:sigma-70 family RNA polymerase sigma factor n=1 Tax=Planctomicrobium sp. SH664 TaxID=3448125 RepID=UPI003F5BF38B